MIEKRLAAAVVIVGWIFSGVAEAEASRVVRHVPNRPIVVLVRTGMTTEVVFPADVLGRTQPLKEFMPIPVRGNRIFLQPRSHVEARFFVDDVYGGHYGLEVRSVPEDEDDTVIVVGGETADTPGGVPALRSDVKELVKSMALGRGLPGYDVKPATPPRMFYEEKGVVLMKVRMVYSSAAVVGYVVDIENLAPVAIRVNPQNFKVKGIIAAAVRDEFLSPREPKDSLEAYRGYPNETTGYLILNGGFVEERWEDLRREEEGR